MEKEIKNVVEAKEVKAEEKEPQTCLIPCDENENVCCLTCNLNKQERELDFAKIQFQSTYPQCVSWCPRVGQRTWCSIFCSHERKNSISFPSDNLLAERLLSKRTEVCQKYLQVRKALVSLGLTINEHNSLVAESPTLSGYRIEELPSDWHQGHLYLFHAVPSCPPFPGTESVGSNAFSC